MSSTEEIVVAIGEYLDYVDQTPKDEITLASEAAQGLQRALCEVESMHLEPEGLDELVEMVGLALAHTVSLVARSGHITPSNLADFMANHFKAATTIGILVGKEVGSGNLDEAPPWFNLELID